MNEETLIEYWFSVKVIVDRVCEEYDGLWQKRSRILTSKIIIMILFKLILGDRRQGLTTNLTDLARF